mmetsp:Transcript_26913/g.37830  ORF Transcript_26913/g.37830 Transcript_26913/m.37830 type:complete len:261 (-) Transcript_26913:445-1227(-)
MLLLLSPAWLLLLEVEAVSICFSGCFLLEVPFCEFPFSFLLASAVLAALLSTSCCFSLEDEVCSSSLFRFVPPASLDFAFSSSSTSIEPCPVLALPLAIPCPSFGPPPSLPMGVPTLASSKLPSASGIGDLSAPSSLVRVSSLLSLSSSFSSSSTFAATANAFSSSSALIRAADSSSSALTRAASSSSALMRVASSSSALTRAASSSSSLILWLISSCVSRGSSFGISPGMSVSRSSLYTCRTSLSKSPSSRCTFAKLFK